MEIIIEFPQYIYDIVDCIKLIVIVFVVYFIFVTCLLPLIKAVLSIISKNLKKNKLDINEFDDFDKIKQEEYEKEQLENEWEFIEEVYNQKYPNNKEKVQSKINSIKLMDNFEPEKTELVDGSQVRKILEHDQSFDVNLFKKWASNIFEYIQLGNSNELKLIKSSISEVLYDKRVLQLQSFEKDGLEIKRDALLVKDVKIYDYYSSNGNEMLKVYIKADLKEYIINSKTKKVLRGNKRRAFEKQYILTFKKIDIEENIGFLSNCPNCGGNIAENEFGRCKYCGSLINPIRYNWFLEKFELI